MLLGSFILTVGGSLYLKHKGINDAMNTGVERSQEDRRLNYKCR